MKRIFKLAMAAGFAGIAAQGSAQSIGAACGCPPVSSRTPVNLSTLLTGGNLTNNTTTLTCNNLYTLDVTMYVNDGQDLFIQPGTVIKANQAPVGTNAYTLIVSRGGQIWANGSQSCPIIMTASADPLDGSYAVTNRGKWGGLILLGRARNNVRNTDLRDGGPNPSNSITGTDGVGLIEGLPAGESRNFYGAPIGQENDDDNSGVLRYVSVRHGGQIIGTANEVNGITFGSVGRGTKVEFIEASSNLDDGLEFFGGTVDVKYSSAAFCDDDYVDYDQDYRGRIQFFYGLQGPDNSGGTNNQGDNGMECDGDDGPGNTAPKSNPTIYNATIIGRWTASAGSGDEAIESRREAQGKIINSVFANFRSGISLADVAVTNWNNGSFEVRNCTFQTRADQTNTGDPVADTYKRVRINGGNASAADYTKFTTDGNLTVGFNTLIDASFAISPLTSNTVTDRVNPVPAAGASAAQSTISAPIDDFFTSVRYRGAFEPGAEPWTKGWTAIAGIRGDVSTVAGCVGDLNKDGVINSADFTLFSGAFGTTCF
ncbi:MAG: hypothetical protein IPJ85_02510 [Flavobacteriales bacterium]|nr:hypothetical protein [Flavobacteriales bacterium]